MEASFAVFGAEYSNTLGGISSTLSSSEPLPCVQGMKVSCTHFQCSAGAFSYLRDHFSHNFSVDMSHQILSLNINLMLVGSTCST